MAFELKLLKPGTISSLNGWKCKDNVKLLAQAFQKSVLLISTMVEASGLKVLLPTKHKLRMRLEDGSVISLKMFWKKQILKLDVPGFKFSSVTQQPCGLGHTEPEYAHCMMGRTENVSAG